MLKQVQPHSLACQNASRVSAYLRENVSALKAFSLLEVNVKLYVVVELVEHGAHNGHSAKNAVLFRNISAVGAGVFGNSCNGRNVAVAAILLKGAFY